jgi:hypothetical protein
MRFHVAFLLALLGLSAAALGQTQAAGSAGAVPAGFGVQRSGTRNLTYPTAMLRANQYARATVPFSAEQVIESVLTVPGGTHITHSQTSMLIFRDSLGRTRIERMFGTVSNPNAPKTPSLIQIRDPIAGAAYLLDPQGKVAHRVALPPSPEVPAPARPANAPAQNQPHVVSSTRVMSNGAESKTEYLGNQVLEGVEVEGQRDTNTVPAGSRGNDQPITAVTETWTSRDLGGTIVLLKRTDPRMGETTQKLINVRLTEQALSLFQPPPDYTVVEETGATISIPLALPQARP